MAKIASSPGRCGDQNDYAAGGFPRFYDPTSIHRMILI
jgi:hypothetical protein